MHEDHPVKHTRPVEVLENVGKFRNFFSIFLQEMKTLHYLEKQILTYSGQLGFSELQASSQGFKKAYAISWFLWQVQLYKLQTRATL